MALPCGTSQGPDEASVDAHDFDQGPLWGASMSSINNPATGAVRAAIESDSQYGAVVPPLHLSSNFAFNAIGDRRQYDYTRSGNPTRDALGSALTELEGGVSTVITSSGMAAIALVLQLVKPGELVVAPHDCYGGTHRLLKALEARGQIKLALVDQTLSDASENIIRLNPRLVLVETPSNPLLRVSDIKALAAASHSVDALLAVDNTFLSPVLQRPILLGADLVIHSTTKYLNGHSDVVGGAVVSATEELGESVAWWANCLGISGAPFDSFLTLRGLRTIHTRIRQHQENAWEIVELLQIHPAVREVHFPGLPGHPGHELAAEQQNGFGGMVSFEIDGGLPAVKAFVDNLELFTLAESLGGVESLVCHPATMTHAALSEDALNVAGIEVGLVRLSIGIEHGADLVRDIRRALNIAISSRSPQAAVMDERAVTAAANC